MSLPSKCLRCGSSNEKSSSPSSYVTNSCEKCAKDVEKENFEKYLNTKFHRANVAGILNGNEFQHSNFKGFGRDSEDSDIRWTRRDFRDIYWEDDVRNDWINYQESMPNVDWKDVDFIDMQFYKNHNLSEDEINLIEKSFEHINPTE